MCTDSDKHCLSFLSFTDSFSLAINCHVLSGFSRLSRWEGDMVLNLKATIWVGRCSQLCSSITGIRVGFRWDVDGGRGEVIQLSCAASSSWMRRFFALMHGKFFILCRKTVCFAFVDEAVRSRIISLSIV